LRTTLYPSSYYKQKPIPWYYWRPVEKSFYENIKIGILRPDKLVNNYWEGYRGYYFSPGKFLTIALFFLLINFLIRDTFFVIKVEKGNIAPNFLLLFLSLFLYSLSTWIVYTLYRKNFNEHFVLNIYTLSLWTIVFVPFSLIWDFIHLEYLDQISTLLYFFLIVVWNNPVFTMSWWKRIIYILLNIIILSLLLYSLLIVSDFDGKVFGELLSSDFN
jgi:hypothetical protein